jgi:esterase/lipase
MTTIDSVGPFQSGLVEFEKHYANKWEDAKAHRTLDGNIHLFRVSSKRYLREALGNHPKILHHGEWRDNVIVLIHGITDSPHYMEAIGRQFHARGFNVVLPLLPAHGLLFPALAMRKLQHRDWVDEVDTVLDIAKPLGGRISLGGFSTGGALTVHKAMRTPGSITGGLFLFSAALDIGSRGQFLLACEAGRMIARIKDQKVWLGSSIEDRIKMIREDQDQEHENEAYGIDRRNPYKYSVFFYEGASQLAKVIEEINDHYGHTKKPRYSDLYHPVFAAHSKTDEAALFSGAQLLIDNHPNEKKKLFPIPDLLHASVVLQEAIVNDPADPLYSPANPQFNEMVTTMLAFVEEQVVSQ